MKKKLLAFVMAATMVFSLAACGSSSSNDSSNSGSSSDSDSAQSGDEVQTFKLGSIGPLTGDAAIYGQAVVNGAQLAVDEINASDSKIKFEFKGEDDEADGEKSTNAYNQLMDWGMQVLVGPTTTGASMAVADVCNSERESRQRSPAVPDYRKLCSSSTATPDSPVAPLSGELASQSDD